MYIDSRAMENDLTGWPGTWKENNQKVCDKEIWGGCVWIYISEWAKPMKISFPMIYASILTLMPQS